MVLSDANAFYSDMPLTFVAADARGRNRNGRGWHPAIHYAVASHIAQSIHDRQCETNDRQANPPAQRLDWDQMAVNSHSVRQPNNPIAALERMLPDTGSLAGRISDIRCLRLHRTVTRRLIL